jgi:nitroreductase
MNLSKCRKIMVRKNMETLEAIKTRPSIRQYKKEAVSDDILKELLEVGMSGPNGGNNKP